MTNTPIYMIYSRGKVTLGLRDVIALVKTDAAWPNYVSELRTWLNAKKVELGI